MTSQIAVPNVRNQGFFLRTCLISLPNQLWIVISSEHFESLQALTYILHPWLFCFKKTIIDHFLRFVTTAIIKAKQVKK